MAELNSEIVVLAEKLDTEICALGRERRRTLARIAALLARMKRDRLYVVRGFGSLADFAKARLDFSAWKTRDLVELWERSESLPLLRAAFESGEVFWSKLRIAARVATAEDEAEWLELARTASARELEQAAGRSDAHVRIVLDLSPEQYADLEEAVRSLRREREASVSRDTAVIELVKRGVAASAAGERPAFQTVIYKCDACAHVRRETREGPVPVPPSTAARAECDSEIIDARRRGRVSKTIPPATRRFALARDRHRCAVPDCSGRDFVEVHHTHPRAQGGNHDPDLLITLCSAHHAAVHDGLLRVGGRAGRFRFFRTDGAELGGTGVLSQPARTLMVAIDSAPAPIDDLIERTGLGASRAFAAATELELAGLAHRAGAYLCVGGRSSQR